MYKRPMLIMCTLMLLGVAIVPARAGLQDGLVAYFKLDESAGTVAADASGNGNDGTLIGTRLEWVPGYDGGSLGCSAPDGTDVPDRLEFPTTGMKPAAGTISLWTYLSDPQPASSGRYLFGHTSALAGRTFADRLQIYMQDGTTYSRKLDLGLGGSHTTQTDIVELPLKEWVQVGVTWDNGKYAVYVNGAQVANGSYSGLTTFKSFANFGNDGSGDPYEAFCGMLDEARVYSRALTAAEVKEIYQAPHTPRIKAWGPSPADGARDVTLPLFKWKSLGTIKLHDVYVGTDPNLTAANLAGPRQALNMFFYTGAFQQGVTYYWRVDEIDANTGQVYQGDVWTFLAWPTTSFDPVPADGTNTASTATTLTWSKGLGAIKHHLYFGDDLDAVQQGAAGVDKGELEDATFTPGDLQAAATYYWRVDEVGAGNAVLAGKVWSFATVVAVDDFESYTDVVGDTVYDFWIDGVTDSRTGSTVGYANAPFAEQKIVHGGLQSMPLEYNNVKTPFYSEAERTFDTKQNWTANGTDTLVLFVQGKSGNKPSQLYVTLKDASSHTATVVHPDPSVVTKAKWTEWQIPLSSFAGVNASAVKVMAIGLDDRAKAAPGGTGLIFIDDIGLAVPAPVVP